MDEQNYSQIWLSLITIANGVIVAVLWYFLKRVIEMPTTYATKQELKDATDGWRDEFRQMREERRQDNRDTRVMLDKIASDVNVIHQRIDTIFSERIAAR